MPSLEQSSFQPLSECFRRHLGLWHSNLGNILFLDSPCCTGLPGFSRTLTLVPNGPWFLNRVFLTFLTSSDPTVEDTIMVEVVPSPLNQSVLSVVMFCLLVSLSLYLCLPWFISFQMSLLYLASLSRKKKKKTLRL